LKARCEKDVDEKANFFVTFSKARKNKNPQIDTASRSET
jgi:hypothetical protein